MEGTLLGRPLACTSGLYSPRLFPRPHTDNYQKQNKPGTRDFVSNSDTWGCSVMKMGVSCYTLGLTERPQWYNVKLWDLESKGF